MGRARTRRGMRVAVFAALAFVAASLVAASASSETLPDGRQIYEQRCSSCHGLSLHGSVDGPPLTGAAAADVDFMLRTGRMPAAVPTGQPLHERALLDNAQIRAVVAYVTHAGGGNAALPVVRSGNAVRGRTVFVENCQACHGVSGRGASVGYAEVAPSLLQATPEEIAEAVRIGPGVMPAFGHDVIDDASVDDVAAYVGVLRSKDSRMGAGGLQLAEIGPVAEGFVGWAFGLGALVLLCRWIGTAD
jgi:ubiquinol-cytochrome c reductase cytochrome c subunit